MRFKITLKISSLKFPLDYRRIFISFIKSLFNHTYLYEDLYVTQKRYKPFSFSVWFGEKILIRDEFIYLNTDLIHFLITSGEAEFISHFYNKVLEFKKEHRVYTYKNEIEFKVQNIELLPYKKIRSSKILFKTLGICVLTDPSQSARDFERWYVTPLDDLNRFNEVLRLRTKEKAEYLLQKPLFSCFLELNPLSETSITREVVKHYGGYVKGFRGYFYIKGDPLVLQFLYDYGLGVRCGQGFGMLEIVREV